MKWMYKMSPIASQILINFNFITIKIKLLSNKNRYNLSRKMVEFRLFGISAMNRKA